MFAIEMLPAAYGDCLWIEYGDRRLPLRILVDGGIGDTYEAILARIEQAGRPCTFELLVVSHVDTDHIDGMVKFLEHLPSDVEIKEIWFNGWQHLPEPPHSRLGGPSGERLTTIIRGLNLPWNETLGGPGHAVVVPAAGPPPPLPLAGRMTLTLLSPSSEQLRKLRPQYAEQCRKAGLLLGTPPEPEAPQRARPARSRRLGESLDVATLAASASRADSSVANGSSIAFLAEFDDRSCLFAADAFPGVIAASITQRLGQSRLLVDAFKVGHHGSKANTNTELAGLVRARKYLLSTDGTRPNCPHPDREAIARILFNKRDDVELWFNYAQKYNLVWRDDGLQRQWGYQPFYPTGKPGWQRVEL